MCKFVKLRITFSISVYTMRVTIIMFVQLFVGGLQMSVITVVIIMS